MAMGGFGLQLGVKADLALNFDDMDELKEHPILQNFAESTFKDLVSMVAPLEEMQKPFDVKEFDAEKL